MPEPLRLDVELGAKGVAKGVKEIADETDGLSVSAHKAASAVKSFAHDVASAKDGTDVASAALGAFTRILGSSVAATVFAAGIKAAYDSFAELSKAVEETKKQVKEAVEISTKGGLAESFAEAADRCKSLEKAIEDTNKRIEEINASPVKSLMDVLTGTTDVLRDQVRVAQEAAMTQRLIGSEAELAYQKNLVGADAEKRAILEVDKALRQQLSSINVLTETKTAANILEAAEIKKNSILQAEAQKARETSEKNYISVVQERAKQELKIYDAEAKARQEARKIFDDFEEARKKAHTEELKASAEKINAIKAEIATLQTKRMEIEAATNSLKAQLGIQLIQSAGTGRGPGQRPTSAEIGLIREIEAGKKEGLAQVNKEIEDRIRKDLEQRNKEKGITTPVSRIDVTNEAIRQAKEESTKAAKAQLEALKKLEKELSDTIEKLKDLNKELDKSKKAQEELNKENKKAKESIQGLSKSVDKMKEGTDLVKKSLEDAGKEFQTSTTNLEKLDKSIQDAQKPFDTFSDTVSDSNDEFTDLNQSASDLKNMFDDLANMQIESITTNEITTEKITLGK